MKKIILTENQYNFLLKENRSELYSYLESVKDNIAKAAQKVYDNWEQDEEGYDEVYGGGGICDDIADAMCNVIQGYDCFHLYNEHDCHTSIYVYDTENKEIYNVDIPPYKYEKGYGYTWEKIQDVELSNKDVQINDLTYDEYIDEDGEPLEYLFN